MRKQIRILNLEDSEDDALLLMRTLRSGGYDPVFERVDTPEAMQAALDRQTWDIILSDFTMPHFNAPAALKLLQARGLDLPFIIISGSIGEDAAVAIMKAGANDYVMKDNPLRLLPAIERELQQAEDRRERKRLENQLLETQKLESIGRLAGGIAHDFNNLLTVILGYVELAETDCVLDVVGQEYLANIRLASEKATNLTRQLLAFARRQVIAPKTVNLNDLILDLDKMLRRLIGEDIELAILPEEELNLVKIDPGQFEQILVNLVVNARDAMPEGGSITINTHNVILNEEYAHQHGDVVPGEYVLLAISDTGSGMEEAVRLHIFEPFFTTKEKGRGTGLGLATVYGIVRQAGGYIWLNSEPGNGTTFKIYLPRTSDALDRASVSQPIAEQMEGSETILLVEDEPIVRAVAAQTLRTRGYTVLEAANGEEALRMVKGREHEIDLLVTDIVMPQMNGKELADRLQLIRPDIKVLFSSGYTEDTVVHHGVLEPGIDFLPKPFTPKVLAHRVREILDGGSTP